MSTVSYPCNKKKKLTKLAQYQTRRSLLSTANNLLDDLRCKFIDPFEFRLRPRVILIRHRVDCQVCLWLRAS